MELFAPVVDPAGAEDAVGGTRRLMALALVPVLDVFAEPVDLSGAASGAVEIEVTGGRCTARTGGLIVA